MPVQPTSRLGWVSVGLAASFLAWIGLRMALEPRWDDVHVGPFNLAGGVAFLLILASGITGLVAWFARRDRAVLLFVGIDLAALALVFELAELFL